MAWVTIGKDKARRHPLYGFDGWLLPLWALWILTIAHGAMHFGNPLPLMDGLSPTGRDLAMAGLGVLLVLFGAVNLSFIVMAPSLNPSMPLVVSGCVWIQQVFWSFGEAVAAGGAVHPLRIGAGAAMALAFTLYLLRSRRVNVTYRHRVRKGDPILDLPAEPAPREPLIIGMSAPD